MDTLPRNLAVIVGKELKHCYRDPHVMIYGIMMPLLFYPLLAIGLFEYFLLQQGRIEHGQTVIAVRDWHEPKIQLLTSALQEDKSIKLVESKDPDKELKEGTVDAILLAGTAAKQGVVVKLHPGREESAHARRLISRIREDKRLSFLKRVLEEKGESSSYLNVFQIQSSSTKAPRLVHQLLVMLFCMTLLTTGLGCFYPSIAVLTEEREKKTLETTLILPIKRSLLSAGKLVAVVIVSMSAGLINAASMGLVISLLILQMSVSSGKKAPIDLSELCSPDILLTTVPLLFLGSVLIASIFVVVSSLTKTFKEAQNALTIPLIMVTFLPMAAIIPGLELNWQTVYIPLMNLTLLERAIARDQVPWLLGSIAIVEAILLICAALWLLTYLLRQEHLLIGIDIPQSAASSVSSVSAASSVSNQVK